MQSDYNVNIFWLVAFNSVLHKTQRRTGGERARALTYDVIDFANEVAAYLHALHHNILSAPARKIFKECESKIAFARAHVGNPHGVPEPCLPHLPIYNLHIFTYLLELVLHTRHDLTFRRGKPKQVPPFVRRIYQPHLLMVMPHINSSLLHTTLTHHSNPALLADKQSHILGNGEQRHVHEN